MKYATPAALLTSLLCSVPGVAATRPDTPKVPVSDTYHGVRVVDAYRWLEHGDVDPMQSRKMVARLQAADPKATVLLRTSGSTGHGGIGAGVKDLVSLHTDVDAFLLHELGVPLSKEPLRVPPTRH